MTENDRTATEFRALRTAVTRAAPPAPAAAVRARARRRTQQRRVVGALAAATATAGVVIGGATLVDLGTDPAPLPPTDPTLTPTPAPTTPEPEPTADETDPISAVDWSTATITVPPGPDCPDGPVTFVPHSTAVPDAPPAAIGPAGTYPAVLLSPGRVAVGDLTGDGRAEAVIMANCVVGEESETSGHGWRLLAVARADDGSLTGLGWVGPTGAGIDHHWIADRELLVSASLQTATEVWDAVPGLAMSYRWVDGRFTDWEPAAQYPPLIPLDPDADGPPVRLAEVATGLECPDEEVRFRRGQGWGGEASAGSARYEVSVGINQQHLVDPAGTGRPLLLVALGCERPGADRVTGLAIFERAGDGWRGAHLIPPPPAAAPGSVPGDWRAEHGGDLVVWWSPEGGDHSAVEQRYRWEETGPVPVDG